MLNLIPTLRLLAKVTVPVVCLIALPLVLVFLVVEVIAGVLVAGIKKLEDFGQGK